MNTTLELLCWDYARRSYLLAHTPPHYDEAFRTFDRVGRIAIRHHIFTACSRASQRKRLQVGSVIRTALEAVRKLEPTGNYPLDTRA